MIRTICSALLILSLIAALLPVSTQADTESFAEIRNEFKSTPTGKKYISQIDRLLPRLSDTQLQETLLRVEEVYWDDTLSETQIEVFEYILAAIEHIQDQKNRVVPSSNVPLAEKTRIETELMQVQNMLAGELVRTLKQSMLDFNTLSFYEDAGDFALDFDMDVEALGTIDSGITLSDYSIKTALFDQQLTAKVSAFIDANIAGEDVSGDLQSLVDFITKDGNIYLLAEKLEVSLKNKELEAEFGDIIEKLKMLAETKTYLSYEDEATTDFINMLGNMSLESITTEIAKQAENPWFVVADKQANEYIILPSQHFCSMMKQLTSVFDPFGGDTCSNTQYKNILEDLKDAGIQILYTPGAQASLRLHIDNPSASGNLYLLWSAGKILSFTGHVVNPESPQSDKISFSYFPRKSFEFLFEARDEGIMFHTAGSLNPAGNLETMNIKANAEKTLFRLNYAQKQLSFDLSMRTYSDDVILCEGSGGLSTQKFDLTAGCEITSSVIEDEIPNSQGKLRLDINTSGDMQEGKNNYNFSLSGTAGNSDIFSLILKNTGTRVSNPNLKIIVPTKTVDIQEVMGEIYETQY